MTAVASVLVIPYITFVPLFAKQILHLDARGFGLLMAANGGGAFLGAVTMAFTHRVRHRGRVVFRASLAFYAFVACFALSRHEWLSALMLVSTGYFMILMIATVNVMLQHLSEDKMRGRVMSIYATAFLGFAPLGSLHGRLARRNLHRPGRHRRHGHRRHRHQQRHLSHASGAWATGIAEELRSAFRPPAHGTGHLRPGGCRCGSVKSMRKAAPFDAILRASRTIWRGI